MKESFAVERNADNIFSKITYTYNGHFVGEAYLLTTTSEIHNSPKPEVIPDEETPLKIIEIHTTHIIIFASAVILIILLIVYLKLTRVARIRRKRIRRQKRLQHQKLHN